MTTLLFAIAFLVLILVVYSYVQPINEIDWTQVQKGTEVFHDWDTYYIKQGDLFIEIILPQDPEERAKALLTLQSYCPFINHH